MKKSLLILIVLWRTTGFAQNNSIPDQLLPNDTLTISIKKSGCHVNYLNILKITPINDTVLSLQFISLHIESYYFEKNDVFKYHKSKAKKFLKENEIKLSTKYNQTNKPREFLVDFSQGLTQYSSLVEQIDSVKIIPSKNYSKIIDFYYSVHSEDLSKYSSTDGLIFVGNYSFIDINLIRNKELLKIIEDKKIKGWFDFYFITKKE